MQVFAFRFLALRILAHRLNVSFVAVSTDLLAPLPD